MNHKKILRILFNVKSFFVTLLLLHVKNQKISMRYQPEMRVTIQLKKQKGLTSCKRISNLKIGSC